MLTPPPSADQLEPFHLAIPFADTPPAVANEPATYSAGPLPSSKTVKARTEATPAIGSGPSGPPARADQVDPFHFAMSSVGTPPAIAKSPPTNSAGPLPSSNTVSA